MQLSKTTEQLALVYIQTIAKTPRQWFHTLISECRANQRGLLKSEFGGISYPDKNDNLHEHHASRTKEAKLVGPSMKSGFGMQCCI